MISLKKYLDQDHVETIPEAEPAPRSPSVPIADANGLLPAAMAAYRSALRGMSGAGLQACPMLGEDLKRGLDRVDDSLSRNLTVEKIDNAERNVQGQLDDWGRLTAQHYQKKTDEVKEILMVMAKTVESVGQRDQRAATQLAQVTGRLKKIATLEDISLIRTSIEESATELKNSIDRIAAEGKAAIQQLQSEVNTYQARLEEAEHIVSVDSLTGLRSRFWMDRYIERRNSEPQSFSILIVDIDDFKSVNDEHGHQVGDELLRQFATEMRSGFRTGFIVSRWGGDEFVVLLDCGADEARSQTERLKKWVCGNYTLPGRSGPIKLNVQASIGFAARKSGESVRDLLARADADMYAQKKTAARGKR